VLDRDRAFVSDDVPATVRARIELDDSRLAVDLAAELAGGPRVGVGGAGRVEVAFERVISAPTK